MDWLQHPDPLERQLDWKPPETAASNAALRDYAAAGVKRSLRDLADTYKRQMAWWKEQKGQQSAGKVQAKKPPTDSVETLYGWSIRYEWQARVKRYDEMQVKADEEAIEAERVEARKLRKEAAKGAFNLMGQTLVLLQKHKMTPRKVTDADGTEHEYPPLVVSEMTLAQAVSSLERAMAMLRKEMGDEREEVDITSGGKPLTFSEVVVERVK